MSGCVWCTERSVTLGLITAMKKLHTCVQGGHGCGERWHIPPMYMWGLFEESLKKGILTEVEDLKETNKGWVKLLESNTSKEQLPPEIEEGRWESSCRTEALKLWEKTAGQEHFLEDSIQTTD